MAISPDLPGLTISIRIGDHKLPEYRDTDIQDPPRVISYMIEAVPDTIFSIHAHASPEVNFTGSSLALYFYVDGKYVDGALIDSSELRYGQRAGARSEGRYVRHNMVRRYQFASRERQIELVETVSTSLSSRPRNSARSSDTPNVSYAGYESRGINSAAATSLDGATDVPSMSSGIYRRAAVKNTNEAFRSVGTRAPSEAYRSTAHPDDVIAFPRETVLPTRPARVHSNSELTENEDQELTATSALRRSPDEVATHSHEPDRGTTDHWVSNTSSFSPEPAYRSADTIITPRTRGLTVPCLSDIADEVYGSQAGTGASTADDPATALSTVKDTESATVGSDFTAPEELGTIKIIVTHVNKKGAVAFGRNASTTAEIGSAAQEAVKDKSGGLLVRFTAPRTVSPITTWDVGAVNDDDEVTSVTYLYHYRTREMLDALGVLPTEAKDERVRPPGKMGLGSDVDESEQGSDEVFRSKRKMSELDGSRQQMAESEDGATREKSTSKKGSMDDEWEMVDADADAA